MQFVNKVLKPWVERLDYQECLPAKEAVMFLAGDKYQTGSDYSEEQLNKTLQEIQEQTICMNCEGTGRIMVDAEDPNLDVCDICDGNGQIYE